MPAQTTLPTVGINTTEKGKPNWSLPWQMSRAASALEIQQISLNFISQGWLIMDNHIALNFFLGSQKESCIIANMSSIPMSIQMGKWDS